MSKEAAALAVDLDGKRFVGLADGRHGKTRLGQCAGGAVLLEFGPRDLAPLFVHNDGGLAHAPFGASTLTCVSRESMMYPPRALSPPITRLDALSASLSACGMSDAESSPCSTGQVG